MKKSLFILVLLISLLPSCSTQKVALPVVATPTDELNKLVDDYFEAYLKLYPLFATSVGDHRFDDQLTLVGSAEHRNQERLITEIALAKAKSIGCARLPEGPSQLTCEIFVRDMTIQVELLKSDLGYLMPFNQFDSFFANFAETASGSSVVTFDSVKDYENFLKRMDVIPAYMDVLIENMREGLKQKITTPQILVDKALKQLHSLLAPNYKDSVFYKPVLGLDKVASGSEKEKLRQRYEEAILTKIYPAYQKLESFVQKEYRPFARKTHGISSVAGGKRYYQALVKFHTTTDLTPDQIMKLGLSEVKRIKGEFEALRKSTGFKGNLNAFYSSFRNQQDAKLYPFKKGEDVLNAYRAIYKRVMTQVPEHFRLLPKAPFEIREVEKFKAENASEAYQNGTPDGSRPGIFWVPIPEATRYPAKDMESLFLHEAIPGHHFQISIQQELPAMPRYRQFSGNNAYVEGWALYTESLGKDLGMYADPNQWAGRLTGEMHRAIRLVVDTGMHWKNWSREKAIQYSKDNEPGDEAGIVSEIERYMVIPGQALSYKMGELKIRELKKKAKESLGEKYSDRDFHDQVLKEGALPLSILDQRINRWINSQSQTKSK